MTTLMIESLLPARNFFREFNTARFDIREMVCYLPAPLRGVERLLARANDALSSSFDRSPHITWESDRTFLHALTNTDRTEGFL